MKPARIYLNFKNSLNYFNIFLTGISCIISSAHLQLKHPDVLTKVKL